MICVRYGLRMWRDVNDIVESGVENNMHFASSVHTTPSTHNKIHIK